uniref:Uncharacterized protein n=1 Tax=Strongyloides papillosus TaxID=174720 RepID=A0A0N5BRW4_STREA
MSYSEETAKKLKRSLIKFKPVINEIAQSIVEKEINDIIQCKKISTPEDISKILKPYVTELSLLTENKNNLNNNDVGFTELAEITFKEEILRTLIVNLRRELGNLYIEMTHKEKNDKLFKQSNTIKVSIFKHLKEILFH